MYKKCLVLVLFCCFVPGIACADYMYDFIRISCIRETGFLDIEYRPIHNSAVDAPPLTKGLKAKDIWAQNGFFDPGGLSYGCSLPESEYKLVAKQDSWRERGECASAPEIIFSLYRNGKVLVKDVVFGESCFGRDTITRISIQDGKRGWYQREVQICFGKGRDESNRKCEWFFEGLGASQKPYPIEQGSIADFLKK